MQLFASSLKSRVFDIPEDARQSGARASQIKNPRATFVPTVDERALEVYDRAKNPDDPFELRNLWLGRVEYELGRAACRTELADQWLGSTIHRRTSAQEALASRATVRFVKELFNWYFRDDLYGQFRSADNLILSSGSVDEQAFGLPETLKECIRYALERDWYGYSDSRGRLATREAVAAYESARIDGASYSEANVALTMGGTSAISCIADFVLLRSDRTDAPALCGIPNYPPLVESVARRRSVELIPLVSCEGEVSLEPLIGAMTPRTPLILIQTATNPFGGVVPASELARLIAAASKSTIIILDECHEWLGPSENCTAVRAASNVVRVSSLSKSWSAPGLKIGWILADSIFIDDYYEYASSTFGGPPSAFYTIVEVLARMERWIRTGVQSPGPQEAAEFESSYAMDLHKLQQAYFRYSEDRAARNRSLTTLRDAAMVGLDAASASVVVPRYSINLGIEFPGWNDSYRCFRHLLRETGVSVFPGILTFCFSGGMVRVTTARNWTQLSAAIERLKELHGVCPPKLLTAQMP